MLLLAAWSTNGWLPSGHAMRMALDLGLHRALEKLADGDSGKKRSEEEERDLGELFFLLLICVLARCANMPHSRIRSHLVVSLLV